MFILGLLLVLLPSIVVGVSGHQNEIVRVGPGLSYIPVYLQYYGLCILFLILVCKNLSNNKWKILLIVTICIVPYVHLLNFREVVNNSNIKYKYPSDLLEKSINTGLLNHLGDKAVILNTNKIPADWIWFLSQKAKKKLNVCAIETFKDCPYVEQLKGNNSISNYEFNHKDFYYLNYDYNHKSKSQDCSLRILLSFTVDCYVNLNKEENEEKMECKRLEVKEISIAAESLQPGCPKQRHVDYSVDRCTDE